MILAAVGQVGHAGVGPVFDCFHVGLRTVLLAGLLVAPGAAAFVAATYRGGHAGRRRAAGVALAGSVVAMLALLAAVPMQAAVVAGETAALRDVGAWEGVVRSSYGIGVLVAAVGIAAVAISAAQSGRRWAAFVAIAGAAVAVCFFPLTGHAVTAEPRWLVSGATFVHGAAAALWVGGLVALVTVLRSRHEAVAALASTVRRFSTSAMAGVGAMALAGLAMWWVHVRTWDALTQSGYGRILALKTLFAVAVLTVGAYNNRRLVPVVQRIGPPALQRLRRTVTVELVGLAAVVAITAVLIETVPAQVEMEAQHPMSQPAS
jgi:copper transport protein